MTRRSLSLAVALGVLGGAVLVLSAIFFTPGKFILVPYAAVVLGTLVAIRAERIQSFAGRFATGLLAFSISSIALYVAVASSAATSPLGVAAHAGRLAFVVGIGALINLATARLAHASERPEMASA
jgi:hypothetical protein